MLETKCVRAMVILLAAALMMLPQSAHAGAQVRARGSLLTLTNGEISTTFDLTSGSWRAYDAGGRLFATDLRCTVQADGTASTAEGRRRHTVSRFRDAYGAGTRLEIEHSGARPFVLVLAIYDRSPLLLVQVRIPGARGLRIHEVTLPEGRLYVGSDVRQVSALVNYWSGEWYSEIHPVDLTEQRPRWDTYSHFFLCAYNRSDQRSAILGALYSEGVNRIEAEVDPARDPQALLFKARCYYDRNDLRCASDTWTSPPYIVCAPTSVFRGLEAYGALALARRPSPLPSPPPTGWCSWDAGASSSQTEMFANVDAMKANRLDEYGLRIVQLDDGWQQGERCSGQWRPRLDRFPAGMKGVADYIRGKGFEPGLWIGPFGEDGGQSNRKELFADGRSGAYDLSSPLFKDYLSREMQTYARDWGFHYIKADFLAYGGTASQSVPYDVSFREAVGLMKAALKPYGGYLLTCINHEWLTAGLSDGQRLGNDVRGGELPGLYTTLKCWPRRYFSNNTFWVGDPDMLHVNLPTDEQSRVWASFTALSGGATMSGDSITKIAPSRIAILKKALPAQGITARPCDLFERPTGWSPKFARIWDCRVARPGMGRWHVVGLFNWTAEGANAEPENVTLDFARHLELARNRRYLVYDFWRQSYLGAFRANLAVGLEPASCRVLVVCEEASVPQVLGTDRHIVSGAPDLKAVRWDGARRTLSGVTRTVRNIAYLLAIHTPAGYVITGARANGRPAGVARVSPYFAKVVFNAGPTGQVRWTISFHRAAAKAEATADPIVSRVRPKRPDAGGEVALRWLAPLWTDQRHDIEGAPLARGESVDLGTTAPFWMCWDISAYTHSERRLVSECRATGGKVSFEVLGDGKRLAATGALQAGEKAAIDVPVTGVRQLTLVCHYVDGWFSGVHGAFIHPRLSGRLE